MLETNRDEGSRSSRWMFKNVSFMAQLRFLGCVYRDVFFFEGGFLVMKRWFDGLKVWRWHLHKATFRGLQWMFLKIIDNYTRG